MGEGILDHRQIVDEKYDYKVKWVGFEETTWEPAVHLNPDAIEDYWKGKGFKMDRETGEIEFIHPKKKKKKKNRKRTSSLETQKSSSVEAHQCSKCDKSFATVRSLNGHQAVHSTKRKTKKRSKPMPAMPAVAYWEDS